MAIALSILAVAGDAFVPAVSALTLGLVSKDKLARRLGRNSAFDHGGNIAIALLAGAVGYASSQRVVFSHGSRLRGLDLGGRARHSSGCNQPGPGERPFLQWRS